MGPAFANASVLLPAERVDDIQQQTTSDCRVHSVVESGVSGARSATAFGDAAFQRASATIAGVPFLYFPASTAYEETGTDAYNAIAAGR